MYDKIYKTEDEFLDNCLCAYRILNFVDNIESDARWFFNCCYFMQPERNYCVIFKSYDMHEYENYVLSIEAAWKNENWNIRIIKKVDNLQGGNVS